MTTIDWSTFQRRTTFIVGSQKHAGKTTFLKLALAGVRDVGANPAYLSVGVDGEGADALSGGLKPTLWAEVGDVLVTTDAALARSGAHVELLHVAAERSVLGRQTVARVRRAGSMELIGPENNAQLAELLTVLREEVGAETILADGAADRVTPAATQRRAGVVLVLRVTPETLPRAVEQTRLLWLTTHLPELTDDVDAYAVDGALTTSRLQRVPDSADALVIADFTRVFLSYREMARLCRQRRVFVRRQVTLLNVVVNLFDVTPQTFHDELDPVALPKVVILNPYAEAAV